MGLRNGSLVCDHCSSTVFEFESFQIAWAAKDSLDSNAGFSYTTQTWQEIDVGENKGCNWCDILWGEIPVWYQRHKKKDCPMPEETFKITVRFQKRNSEDHIVLRVIVEDDWPALIWQVASPWAFKLASDCLVQCTLRHHCPKARETSLPTRVVDCSNPERPKLVLTKGMRGFYAALSYVWGEPQPHSTCTTKLSTYLEAIDILLLPQTIKDAIVCTHNLNLRYLWTDSLCILQDSDEDKQREIPHMCDIYRDAYVTIIAASSQKVSEGFLRDRKRPVETPLPFWCPDGRLGTISVDEDESARPNKEPVNLRAWCFQERVLSPRTLVYASHTLQYQCQTAMSDIGDIWHYLPSTELGELRLPDMMISRTPCSTPSSDDVQVLLAAWEDVLRDYTQRAVSYPSDRLVAISGIAQLFQRWWGSSNRYIAGLWERNLSTDLLWYRHQPSQGRLVTGQYLAPSWSWAATIGRVVAGSDTKGTARNILWDVQLCEAISVSDNHPLGQVKGGKLIVRAIVKDVTWDPTEPELFEL
ncbi:HET-domain-containing protein, partial [Rhizopogon vinicolor AM-OR11-026]